MTDSPASIDLADFEPLPFAVVPVLHPFTGEVLMSGGEPITLSIAGQDSDTFHQRQLDMLDKRLERSIPGQRPMTAIEVEEERLETLARCTVGWERITYDGKPLEHSTDAARQLFRRLPWLREQVDRAIMNRPLHMKKQADAAGAENAV